MIIEIPIGLQLLFGISNAAVEEDCTSGLAISIFDDSDKVGADVVLLHGCPQSCMPNPVEGLPQVCEDMVGVLLCWRYFSQRILGLKVCSVVLHPALKPVNVQLKAVF